MSLPVTPRVTYELNPLEAVICQLQFPTILRVDTEIPTEFQEAIREHYPYYKNKPALQFPAGLPAELAAMIAKGMPSVAGQTAHEFSSKDEKWMLTLTRDFMALTCHSYDNWGNFKEHLRAPFSALQRIYTPPFFIRLGLRYRNLIRKSTLGLQQVGWNELLKEWVAGAYSSTEVATDILHSVHQLKINLQDVQGSPASYPRNNY